MSVEFTPQQKRVIDLRNCNILVSAAAGSGKTAVLTERIVNMICDETNPVDVDRLLVVTFTGAAAAEMRERIGNKLSERLLENPESEHLQRQVTLLHAAQITTIDSFCLFLIKNHFQEIGLDPAFRVADEREIKLLQQEVMEELLEDAFTEGREGFLNCVEALCPRGKERVLEEHILNLSRYAASFPWPKEWLKERKLDYAQTEGDEAEDNGTEGDGTEGDGTEGDGTEGRKAQVTRTSGQLDDYFKHYVSGVLSGCVQKMEQAIWLSELPDGPYVYGKLLEQERDMIAKAAELGRPEGIVFGKLPGKKDDSVDPAKRDLAKGIRDDVKKTLTDLQDQFFPAARSTAKERDQACQSVANELIDLVLSFDERMQEKKREKKLIDFTDMEHFALDILLTQENGELQPTQVARQYREYFHEILIDEYQDSNLVQEYLLWAVSGEQDGKYNRFMVGDVKQCIYHFRLARPELFLEKYGIYEPEGPKCKIDLSKNFRSRESVISTVNRIFERAMSKEVGGIVYDDAAALHQGAKYPELSDMESELYLVAKPKKNDKIKPKQAEAIAVAERISQLLRQGQVTDPKTGSLRSVRCKDIVILLRTLTGWGEQYKAALEERGIPAYVTSKSGYFTATEVQDVLNFLRVIDNPLQDVPLYGVLRSFFGGFTEEEIARVRGGEHEATLYESLLQSEDTKVQAFLSKLHAFREKTSFLPMRALLENIIWEYDYLNYVAALPGGSKRKANLEMLLVKASDFEKTSYYGLFHFLRYIEQLEKYEEDYGEAETLDENADVVRIMSIHKSKGLEFPVVFVSGLAKGFNMQDVNKAVILDADLGIGMDYVNPVARFQSRTLRKSIVAKKMREDTIAEELRLLYVALTRAREKVILTAEVEDPEAILSEARFSVMSDARLSYLEFMKAGCFLDFLVPVLHQTGLLVTMVSGEELLKCQVLEQLELGVSKENLERAAELADPEALEKLKERFAFQYPYGALKDLYTKTTVSELKIAAMSESDEAAFHAFEEHETESYVPEFRREGEEVTGTVRGNAYHRVMELLDFEQVLGYAKGEFPETFEKYQEELAHANLTGAVEEFLLAQVRDLRLSEEYRRAVRPEKICKFLKSDLGYRMARADLPGKLKREQPFVLAIPAQRLKEEFPPEEKVLIQGIIDVYFVEDDGIVLLDYKTDSIESMEALWNRYSTQLDYYQEALERLTTLPVKEKILYSFHLETWK